MIDNDLGDYSQKLSSALADCEQGDVLTGLPFFYYGSSAEAAWLPTRDSRPELGAIELETRSTYSIITTQTCDICEEESDKPRRPFLQVAPVFDGLGLDERKRFLIDLFEVSYLVRLTGTAFSDGFWVADLRIQMPFDKGILVGRERLKGFGSDNDLKNFADQLGRLYTRPVFPAPVHTSIVDSLRQFFGTKSIHRDRFAAARICELRVRHKLGTPIDAEVIVITEDASTTEKARDCLNAWYLSAQAKAMTNGVNIIGLEYTTELQFSARALRASTPISLSHVRIDKAHDVEPIVAPVTSSVTRSSADSND